MKSFKILLFILLINQIRAIDETTTQNVQISDETTEYVSKGDESDLSEVPMVIEEKDEEVVYESVSEGLTAAPVIEDENEREKITTLTLDKNNIIELSNTTFNQLFINLKTLSVKNNAINQISDTLFINLPNLKTLDLSDNSPKDLNGLNESLSLTELILDNVELDLSKSPIPSIPNLKKLIMTNCKLSTIPKNAFEGVPLLEELDLGNNDIKIDPPTDKSSFEDLNNLKTLILPESGTTKELMDAICQSNKDLKTICIDLCETESDHICKIEDITEQQATDKTTQEVQETTTIIIDLPSILDESTDISKPKKVVFTLDNTNKDYPEVMPLPPQETTTKASKKFKVLSDPPENLVPETSRSGVTTSSVNETAVGAIVGLIILIAAAVVVKKNWSTIKNKFGGGDSNNSNNNRNSNINSRTQNASNQPKTPEEVPLQSKGDQNPV